MNDEAKAALYWKGIADHHYAKRQEAEARAQRWKDHALAWEQYDYAAMLGTEEEVNEAKRVLDATTNQLVEIGELPEYQESPR